MKKAIFIVVVFTLFLATIAKAQNSFTFSRPDGSHFGCVVMPDSTVKITGGKPDTINGDLILPDTVTHNGRSYVVTTVGASAFCIQGQVSGTDYFRKPWPNIYIPNTVKLIERQAFFNTVSWEIYIGSSVDTIGDFAFNAGFFRKLIYNAKNSYVSKNNAFNGTCGSNYNVHELVIGDSVQVIPRDLVLDALRKTVSGNGLEPKVTIGASVRHIDDDILSDWHGPKYIMRCPPPTLSPQALLFVRSNSQSFHIPCHLQPLYRADSVWSTINFDTTPYIIDLRALHGHVEQLATPDCSNDTFTLRAIPDTGYRFVHWNDGDTNATHSFVVSGDTTITARFEPVTDSNVVYFFDFQNPAQDTMWKLVPDRFKDSSIVSRWVIDKRDNHNINGSRCMRMIYVRPRMCTGGGSSPRDPEYANYLFCPTINGGTYFAHTRQALHFNGLYMSRFDVNNYSAIRNGGATIALLPDSVDIPDSALVKQTFNLPSSAITLTSGQKTFIPDGYYRLVIKYYSSLADTLGASIDNIMFEEIDSVPFSYGSCIERIINRIDDEGDRYHIVQGGFLGQTAFSGMVKVRDTLTIYPTPISDSTKGHFAYWGFRTTSQDSLRIPYGYDSISDSNVVPLRYVVYNEGSICAVYQPNKFPLTIDTTNLPNPLPTNARPFNGNLDRPIPKYCVFGEGMHDWNSVAIAGITVPQGWVFTQWNDGNTKNPRPVLISDTTILRPILVPATVTLSSMSENGYAKWSDGNTNNPRTIKYPSDTALTVMYGTRINMLTNGNFEDSTSIDPWVLVNGQNTNSWVVGTAVRNGGQRGLYVSDDGGTTNHATNVCGNSFAYIRLHLDTGTYYCTFDWREFNNGGPRDGIKVALVSDSNNLVANNNCSLTYPAGSINLNNGNCFRPNDMDTSWQKHSEYVTVSDSGTYKLVFGYFNNSINNTIPIAVDNVVFAQINGKHTPPTQTLYDTIQVRDTLRVNDTIWHNDTIRTHVFDTTTIYIYDTVHVYDTTHVSIQGAEAIPWKIGQDGNCIIVSGADGYNVKVYDVSGRCLHIQPQAVGVLRFRMLVAGVYLVQVGDSPAKQVVIPHS